jgi:hypothetical protein
MAYYIRILGTKLSNIPVQELQEVARPAVLEPAESSGDTWEELILRHEAGQDIAIIERNPVVLGGLGAEELQEFLAEVPHYRPNSAVGWLQSYLPTVKVIYAFQLLNGTDVDHGWTVLHRLFDVVRSYAGGIVQADGEGFSKRSGLYDSMAVWGIGYWSVEHGGSNRGGLGAFRNGASKQATSRGFLAWRSAIWSETDLTQIRQKTDEPRGLLVRTYSRQLLPLPLINLLRPLHGIRIFGKLVRSEPHNPRKSQRVPTLMPVRFHHVVERDFQHNLRFND